MSGEGGRDNVVELVSRHADDGRRDKLEHSPRSRIGKRAPYAGKGRLKALFYYKGQLEQRLNRAAGYDAVSHCARGVRRFGRKRVGCRNNGDVE